MLRQLKRVPQWFWSGFIILQVYGCSESDSSTEEATSSTSNTSSNSSSTTGMTGDDFSHCGNRVPDSSCSVASTCLEANCGSLRSELDEEGCVRVACLSDDDCLEDELCFPGPVVSQSSNYALSCSMTNAGRCQCAGSDVTSGGSAQCFPRQSVLGDWACQFDETLMADCVRLSDWISAADALLSQLTLYSTVATRSQACVAEATSQYETSCP